MKNILPFLLLSILVFACKGKKEVQEAPPVSQEEKFFDMENSLRNSDTWVGTYTGTIPCADCKGIRVEVTLNLNQTYSYKSEYLGKLSEPNIEQGTLEWDPKNPIILSLKGNPKHPIHFLVQGDQLIQLDQNREIIRGDLAEKYILKRKKGKVSLLQGKTWTLVEVYGERVATAENAKPAVLIFSDYRTVNGNGGCNSYFGSYTIETGNRIQFSGLGSTEMFCEFKNYDEPLMRALGEADNFVLGKEGQLRLQTGKRAAHAVFQNKGN